MNGSSLDLSAVHVRCQLATAFNGRLHAAAPGIFRSKGWICRDRLTWRLSRWLDGGRVRHIVGRSCRQLVTPI